jgi:glycyl-tRNA synthetase
MPDAAPPNVMEQIVSLCKRRGFVYPASEIYGGLRGFWDYGPLGVLLKNNIRDHWWRNMVECPPIGPDGHPVEIVGLDSAIIQHPKTWEASGHVASFNDPMVDDSAGGRHRADHLFGLLPDMTPAEYETLGTMLGEVPLTVPVATCVASSVGEASALFRTDRKVQKLFGIKQLEIDKAAEAAVGGNSGGLTKGIIRGRTSSWSVHTLYTPGLMGRFHLFPSPINGEIGTLSEPRPFSLMLHTYPGPIHDEANKAYLRPETAQGIFLEFKNIADTTRVKVPFGVAQVGKSFRNEVTPRNFIFRSREFEQMEMEFFCPPDDALKWYAFWREERMKWWLSLGVRPEHLRFRDHATDELAFYSKATVDIEYLYPFTAPDFGELEGVAHRGDYDLTQHTKHSGVKLDYFDQELQLKLKEQGASPEDIKAKSRYTPNVIEPASGLTRAVLVLLCECYRNEKGRAGTEEWFAFKPQFAPIKCGVFPLVNKDGMPEFAEKLFLQLRQRFTCEYDPKQSIGKRYARMDEIGTPFCVTVDGQTLTDGTVTVRDRDTMQQQRVPADNVAAYLRDRIDSAA